MKIHKKVLSACTGACTAVLVMSIAFASAPSIGTEDEIINKKEVHTLAAYVTDNDMEFLSEHMDQEILNKVKDSLVGDKKEDILSAYMQYDQDFESYFSEYMSNN